MNFNPAKIRADPIVIDFYENIRSKLCEVPVIPDTISEKIDDSDKSEWLSKMYFLPKLLFQKKL